MRPHSLLAALDRQLALKAEAVTFRRSDGTTTITVEALASVRGHEGVEVAGGLTSQAARVILSPTPFLLAGLDPLPQRGDVLVIGGRTRRVEEAGLIRIGTEVVRIEAEVVG